MSATRYFPPPGASLAARLCSRALLLFGWNIVVAQPIPKRCVAIFYPHTSNWDTVIGLFAKTALDLRIRFVAKHTLFVGPLGWLLTRLGGIPVNRSEPAGFIGQIERAFARHEEFRLAIAPEGTRSRTEYWKAGFYHIAREVGVPVALAFIDYPRKEIGIGAYAGLTGDVDADMARIAEFYRGKVARNPDNAGPIRLREPPAAIEASPAGPPGTSDRPKT